MIERQIHRYRTELGLSYKEIAQAVVFFKEVQKGEYQDKYGIGIVPTVIDQAREYFRKKREEREKQIQSARETENEPDIILNVSKIKKRRKLERINIDEIEVD